MVNGIAKALQSLWVGTCTITRKESYKQGTITKQKDVIYANEVPCRLSYQTTSTATSEETSTATKVSQYIKLFLEREVEIPSGSKIIVTQHGKTVAYKESGQPIIHANHQELILDLYEKTT